MSSRASPLVSVIVPLFNAQKWIGGALDSALAQTWTNTEVIVVDDGSSDQSLAIARSYQSARVRVITQERKGAAHARNHGIELAQGDYIQYLDADDLMSPNKLSAQIDLLRGEGPSVLATCGACYFHDRARPEAGVKIDGWPAIDTDDPVDWLIRLYGGDDGRIHMVPIGSWLVPRALAGRAGPWDMACLVDDDGEYFCRIVLASTGIRTASGAYYFYRKHALKTSLSSSFAGRHLLSAMYAQDRKADHLLARTTDPRAKRALARCYVDHAVAAYPFCRAATRHGLSRARALDADYAIPDLSGVSEKIRRVLGWKAARWCSASRYLLRHFFGHYLHERFTRTHGNG